MHWTKVLLFFCTFSVALSVSPAMASHECEFMGWRSLASYYNCLPNGGQARVTEIPRGLQGSVSDETMGTGRNATPRPRNLGRRPLPHSTLQPPLRHRDQLLTNGLRTYADLARSAAERHGVDPRLVKSLIKTESNWNPWAVSPKGARGMLQLMPETARRLGVRNHFDAKENIEAGVRHLGELLQEFQDVRLALAAYNAGAEAVRQCRCVPQNSETPFFVEAVLRRYRSG